MRKRLSTHADFFSLFALANGSTISEEFDSSRHTIKAIPEPGSNLTGSTGNVYYDHEDAQTVNELMLAMSNGGFCPDCVPGSTKKAFVVHLPRDQVGHIHVRKL